MTAYFIKRDPATNKARFYSLQLVPTLLGDWALQREWGPIGRPGRVINNYHPDQASAEKMLAKLVRRRQRRGYSLALPPGQARP